MLEYAATLDHKCKPTVVVKKGILAGAAGGAAKKADVVSWRDLPVEKRLEHALIKVIKGILITLGFMLRSSWSML
jgi:5-methyltetrahydrofolate--homocysteine methyltransferase